jgi:hypothetical protein
MGITYDILIAEMLRHAPDPNETLPIANRPETIWGTTVPFLVGNA